MIGELEEKL